MKQQTKQDLSVIKQIMALGSKKFRPMIDTKIMKEYKGKMIEVLVVNDGFSYAGEVYKSLSDIASNIAFTFIYMEERNPVIPDPALEHQKHFWRNSMARFFRLATENQ